jgi:hypothetical protein
LLNLLKIQQQWPEDKDNILQAVGLTYQWDSDAPVGSRILEVIDREGNVLVLLGRLLIISSSNWPVPQPISKNMWSL